MITEFHNDGCCFKVMLTYTDYVDSSSFEPIIFYGEDVEECLKEIKERHDRLETLGQYPVEIKIQDDSK